LSSFGEQLHREDEKGKRSNCKVKNLRGGKRKLSPPKVNRPPGALECLCSPPVKLRAYLKSEGGDLKRRNLHNKGEEGTEKRMGKEGIAKTSPRAAKYRQQPRNTRKSEQKLKGPSQGKIKHES